MEEILEGIKWFALFWAAYSIITEVYNWLRYYYPILPENNICGKCLSFWSVTAITLNPFIGAISAFLYFTYENYFKIDIKL